MTALDAYFQVQAMKERIMSYIVLNNETLSGIEKTWEIIKDVNPQSPEAILYKAAHKEFLERLRKQRDFLSQCYSIEWFDPNNVTAMFDQLEVETKEGGIFEVRNDDMVSVVTDVIKDEGAQLEILKEFFYDDKNF